MTNKLSSAHQSHSLRMGFIIGLAMFISVLSLNMSGLLLSFEQNTYDLLTRRAAPETTSADIIIVAFDQRTVNGLKQLGLSFPWPRDIYEPVLHILSESEAVYLDVFFSEPSGHDRELDLLFNQSMANADNVYMATPLEIKNKTLSEKDRLFLKKMAAPDSFLSAHNFGSALLPTEDLRTGLRGIGNVTITPDSDGIFRKNPLICDVQGYRIPHLATAHLVHSGRLRQQGSMLRIDNTPIPLQDNNLLIRYPKNKAPFKQISFIDILAAAAGENPDNTISAETFRGKHVFIGYTAKGLFDLRATPVSATTRGVWVHAVVLDNLLKKDFLKPLNPIFFWALILMLSLGASVFIAVNQRMTTNLIFLGSILLLLVLVAMCLFRMGVYMPLFAPAFALSSSFAVSAVFSYASEGRRRTFLRNTFGRYMDQKIVVHLLENPDLIAPGGVKRKCTVFFADIAGFTTISEAVSPEKTARMLYEVLSEMTELIIHHNGVIDKYIGDCIMAFWGAPAESETDEDDAARAAISCVEALAPINESLKRQQIPPIDMRFGIHTGDAIAGNLGSKRLFDFTVIGDTVNLASRLEGVNKVFGTRIIVSEDTRAKLKTDITTRILGHIAVKGKSHAITIHEVIGTTDRLPETEKNRILKYKLAMDAFFNQDFQKAFILFETLTDEKPDDGPARYYASWCRQLIDRPPQTDDWQIIRMDTK